MLYTAAMILGNDTFSKFIHFSFGILTLVAIYKLSRKFLSRDFSILASAIFYANLVVGWETITAYVDLAWAFFTLMAFWGLLILLEKRNNKWLVLTGIMFGLAVSVKLIALFALPVFLLILIYDRYQNKDTWTNFTYKSAVIIVMAFIIPLPWLIFAFVNTGNPFYPYFTNQLVDSGKTLVFPNLRYILVDAYNFFLRLNDPISPIYLVVLPLIIVGFKKFSLKIKYVALFCFSTLLIWYLTQEQRGGRFILPYLPVFSILAAYVIEKIKLINLRNLLVTVVILVSIISIGYRTVANAKFVPVVLGKETSSQFLTKYLNFSFGDFYDTDSYFQKHISKNDTVLLYGFGKLYYVNFKFIDSTWVKKGDKFNYIAVQNGVLPARFTGWQQIYYNSLTKVSVYTKGEKMCVY
jgi:4-amino-4-deoxy-L-arabinose transferase-like glycosyltransferase